MNPKLRIARRKRRGPHHCIGLLFGLGFRVFVFLSSFFWGLVFFFELLFWGFSFFFELLFLGFSFFFELLFLGFRV